nr:MAG TPA: hypothetical protein [Bacteriophage sp.]
MRSRILSLNFIKGSNPTPLSHSGKVAEMVPIKHKNRPLAATRNRPCALARPTDK